MVQAFEGTPGMNGSGLYDLICFGPLSAPPEPPTANCEVEDEDRYRVRTCPNGIS